MSKHFVYIDSKLSFNEHIKQSCIRAARQLNALSRISKFLDLKAKKLVFKSFIMSNFTYCPLVWHFCGKTNNAKVEKIHERALKIVCNDYISDYESLMKKIGVSTMVHSRLLCILLEVFKSIKKTNPTYFQDLFESKDSQNSLRNPSLLVQPIVDTTNYGLRTFTYLGSKLWNDLPSSFKDIDDTDIDDFKIALKKWSGPNYDNISNFYV